MAGSGLQQQGQGQGQGAHLPSSQGGGDSGRLVARLSAAATHACVANVKALGLGLRATAVSSFLAAASSHGEAAEALRQAAALTATSAGAAALASCPQWLPALTPLLSTAPATGEDRELWDNVLRLTLSTLVCTPLGAASVTPGSETGSETDPSGSGTLQEPGWHQRVAKYLADSALPVLSAPAAARAPKALPLALAGSSAASGQAEEAAAGPLGVQGQQQLVRLTRLLLRLLAGFAR